MELGGLTASLTTTPKVKASFPDFQVLVSLIENVEVKEVVTWFEALKKEVTRDPVDSYDPEFLKDKPVLRSYRDFFWEIRVNLTRNRPVAGTLIRRGASGKRLPRINFLVELYNLASIKTEIVVAAFNADRLTENLKVQHVKTDEKPLGIEMRETLELQGGEIVVQDGENLVPAHTYRDAEDSRITENTMDVLLFFYDIPEIRPEKLSGAIETSKVITHFRDESQRLETCQEIERKRESKNGV
jgi:DNA/RNA-binding domain of Phe-tRNA-synthetase-like protein